jgi:hypothetical protein
MKLAVSPALYAKPNKPVGDAINSTFTPPFATDLINGLPDLYFFGSCFVSASLETSAFFLF